MLLPTSQGALRLFRFAGINVYLHWSWFVVAVIELRGGAGQFRSLGWNALEYGSLFGIVLLHEFGHALACRSVGGQAEQIVLWPFGGVAYVNPPQRPGATLWSIAAGPLVNVALLGLATGALVLNRWLGWVAPKTDPHDYLWSLWFINFGLLCFNLLPVYPLDGGQMLRSVLWFWLGRARSLAVATGIGLVGVLGLVGVAIWWRSFWIGLMAVFISFNCWRGWKQAQALLRLARLPRHAEFACPVCGEAPPQLAVWMCGSCRLAYDPFATGGTCPQCGALPATTTCVNCGEAYPFWEWRRVG